MTFLSYFWFKIFLFFLIFWFFYFLNFLNFAYECKFKLAVQTGVSITTVLPSHSYGHPTIFIIPHFINTKSALSPCASFTTSTRGLPVNTPLTPFHNHSTLSSQLHLLKHRKKSPIAPRQPTITIRVEPPNHWLQHCHGHQRIVITTRTCSRHPSSRQSSI